MQKIRYIFSAGVARGRARAPSYHLSALEIPQDQSNVLRHFHLRCCPIAADVITLGYHGDQFHIVFGPINGRSLNMKNKKPYRKNPGFRIVELEKEKSKCGHCHYENKIDWLSDMPYPHQTVKSDHGDQHWIPVSFPMDCENCKQRYDHNVPIIERNGTYSLYGDEAGRIVHFQGQDIHFFCLSIVGVHERKREQLQNQLRNFKLEARPDADPSGWPHHFTELWGDSGPERKYSFDGVAQKIDYGKRFAKMIEKAQPELVCFNFSNAIVLKGSSKDKAAAIKFQKEDLFKQAILMTLDVMVMHKSNVRWYFDNVKDATDRERTEGWAEECFRGLQYTRLFTQLAAGALVPEPKFLRPGSHFLLEIADFISFWFARDFLKISQKKISEVPSAWMGKIKCYRIQENGQCDAASERGTLFLSRYFAPGNSKGRSMQMAK